MNNESERRVGHTLSLSAAASTCQPPRSTMPGRPTHTNPITTPTQVYIHIEGRRRRKEEVKIGANQLVKRGWLRVGN